MKLSYPDLPKTVEYDAIAKENGFSFRLTKDLYKPNARIEIYTNKFSTSISIDDNQLDALSVLIEDYFEYLNSKPEAF